MSNSWFWAGVGKPGGPCRISLAVWNARGLTWGSWETKGPGESALLLLLWAVLALAKFPRGAPMVKWINQLTCTLMELSNSNRGKRRAKIFTFHCNAFRPKLDSSGGLSKNMLGQGYQVKLFQHHPNNLASEAFNGFFSKKRMMEIIGDGNGGGDDDNNDVDVGDLEDDVEKTKGGDVFN